MNTSSSTPSTVVVLVRHAERAVSPPDDPPLTAGGRARARALSTALRDAGVTRIIVTQYRRTKDTAQELATVRNITPEVVEIDPANLSPHVEAVAAAIRAQAGSTVLVVGHNTTVPRIIGALGGPSLPDIPESTYSRLFFLVLGKEGTRLIQSSYGARSGG